MARLSSTALVLRTRPYGEADLIVDLLTEQRGRTAVIARGALRSKRRYMGVLEPGALVKVDYVLKSGLPTLGPCDVLSSHRKLRQDLDALRQLYYILEILRVVTPLEQADPLLFEAVVELLAALESAAGLPELLIYAWELKLLAHLGHGLRIERCPLTGEIPDGISPRAGSVVSSRSGSPSLPVRTEALRVLYRIQRGELSVDLDQSLTERDHTQLREAFVAIWREISGQPLLTAQIFSTMTWRGQGAVGDEENQQSL